MLPANRAIADSSCCPTISTFAPLWRRKVTAVGSLHVKLTVGDDGQVSDVRLCDYTSPQTLQ